ncbi:hypothetical protein [Micromonospora sp. NPDC049107]|uniref:hypothetical protein n=1 Tax=unclassified Micromonospora TaxID=2617518 RepID=UPI0033CB0135
MARTSGTRAAAIRRAQEAKQRRDAEQLQRSRQITDALTDFYEQTQRAADITAHGAEKAARIIADAEQAAREPARLAAQAVARLEALGETRGAIAELTGLPVGAVRDLISQASAARAEPEHERTPSHPPHATHPGDSESGAHTDPGHPGL